MTLHEDRCRVRTGQAAHAVAVTPALHRGSGASVNNVVLGLFARLGYTSAPEARRHFAAHFHEAVNLVLRAST